MLSVLNHVSSFIIEKLMHNHDGWSLFIEWEEQDNQIAVFLCSFVFRVKLYISQGWTNELPRRHRNKTDDAMDVQTDKQEQSDWSM